MRADAPPASIPIMKVPPPLAITCAAWLAFTTPATAETRTWTNREGRKIQAELDAYDPATRKVTLKLATGARSTIPSESLSDADQEYITETRRKEDEARAALRTNGGKTVTYRIEGETRVSYYVYYPTNYNPDNPPPMIILFSPVGSGQGILAPVRDACEKLGWLGVGCDVFRNGANEAVLDAKWKEVLPHIEKTVPHNPDLLYLGGMSGGALRAYSTSEFSVRPWKGVLAFGGWLGGKKTLRCAPKMAVAIVNGDKDKNANAFVEPDLKVLNAAGCRSQQFSFPGGHEVAPPEVVLQAMEWLKKSTVPGKRLPAGKRSPALLSGDTEEKKKTR